MAKVHMRYTAEIVRNGKSYWYFRKAGKRGRLPGEPGSAKWLAEYNRLLAQADDEAPLAPSSLPADSFGASLALYYKSAEFARLSQNSQAQYRRVLNSLTAKLAAVPVGMIRRKHVLMLRGETADKPATANHLVGILSGFFKWAVKMELTETSPTKGIEAMGTGEHHAWPKAAIQAALDAATPEVRIALLLAYYTGQRRGDLCAMRWDNIEDGMIHVVQQKTKKELWIPIHHALAEALAAAPRVATTILANRRGVPWEARRLTEAVAKVLAAVGYPSLTLHGLRKSAAVALAEAGCSAHEIQAITGHASLAQMEHYAKSANQKRLATAAIVKLERAKK